MKAIVSNYPNHSQIIQSPKPNAKNNEVLVKIKATGINRADVLQIQGLYKPPTGESTVLGIEFAGIIEETGERVCSISASGAYAEYIAIDRKLLITIPDDMSFEEAASLPEALFTSFVNLFMLSNIKKSDDVLIHSATSSIGVIALQIAKIFGANPYASCGSEEKKDFLYKLGANKVINYQKEDFSKIIKEEGGVDIILDILGGKYLENNISSLKKYGRLAIIALMNESKGELNLASVLLKNLQITGYTLRDKTIDEKIKIKDNIERVLLPHIRSQEIKPIIDSIFNFEEYKLAHQKLIDRKNLGKVILKLGE